MLTNYTRFAKSIFADNDIIYNCGSRF